MTDRPRVGIRALNECFYGERWTPEDRLAVLEAGAAFGANAYVYGPSADQRTGGMWRDLYEGSERDNLRAFARRAMELGVAPIWRVSPAAPLEPRLAISIADPDDLAALVAKIEDVIDLGFTQILIAFDDLTAGLDAATTARFSTSSHPLAAAHAHVLVAVADAVGASRLLACPMHYWGTDPSPYRQEFGRGFPAEIPVCWTGPSVISEEIRAVDARAVADEVGHPLWIWDNYPVNDWDMEGIAARPLHALSGLDNLVVPRRLPLAPLTNRDPDLGDVAVGMGFNLALDPWSGLPAALTALDFAWSGRAYRPDDSWRAAVTSLGVDPDALAVLADAAGPGSGRGVRTPSELAAAVAAVFVAESEGEVNAREARLVELEDVIDRHIGALSSLRSRPNRLTTELHPWMVELGRQCQFALLAVGVLRGKEPTSVSAAELGGALGRRSAVSVASGMGRALAEYARGLVAGGTPEIDVPNASSFGH